MVRSESKRWYVQFMPTKSTPLAYVILFLKWHFLWLYVPKKSGKPLTLQKLLSLEVVIFINCIRPIYHQSVDFCFSFKTYAILDRKPMQIFQKWHRVVSNLGD